MGVSKYQLVSVAGELRFQPPYIQLYIYGLRPYISWYNQDNQSHFNNFVVNLNIEIITTLISFSRGINKIYNKR
jgi:hypothetical protein